MSPTFNFTPGRVFFKFDMGKSGKVYYGGCGDQTHDPKTHDLSTTPFVMELEGY